MTKPQLSRLGLLIFAVAAVAAVSGNLIGQKISARAIETGDLLSFVGALLGAGITVWGAAFLANSRQRQDAAGARAFLDTTVEQIWTASTNLASPLLRYPSTAGVEERLSLMLRDIAFLAEADDVLAEAMKAARDRPFAAIAPLHRVHSILTARREQWEAWIENAPSEPNSSIEQQVAHFEWVAYHINEQAEQLRECARIAADNLGIDVLPFPYGNRAA